MGDFCGSACILSLIHIYAGYVKERPADCKSTGTLTDLSQWKACLEQSIFPDHKLMPQHRSWIGYTLKFMVNSLLQHCHGREERFLDCLLAYCKPGGRMESSVVFLLLDTFAALPLDRCTPAQTETLLHFAEGAARSRAVSYTHLPYAFTDSIAQFLRGG